MPFSQLRRFLGIHTELCDGLDCMCYTSYNITMKESKAKPTTSVRVDPSILHKARVAAVTTKKTLGKWLEEAIVEKIDREK